MYNFGVSKAKSLQGFSSHLINRMIDDVRVGAKIATRYQRMVRRESASAFAGSTDTPISFPFDIHFQGASCLPHCTPAILSIYYQY